MIQHAIWMIVAWIACVVSTVGCSHSEARPPILSAPLFRKPTNGAESHNVLRLRAALKEAGLEVIIDRRDTSAWARRPVLVTAETMRMLAGENVANYRLAQSPDESRLVIAPTSAAGHDRIHTGALRIYEKDPEGWLLTRSVTLPEHVEFRWREWNATNRFVCACIHYPGQRSNREWWWFQARGYSTLLLDARDGVLYQIRDDAREFVTIRLGADHSPEHAFSGRMAPPEADDSGRPFVSAPND